MNNDTELMKNNVEELISRANEILNTEIDRDTIGIVDLSIREHELNLIKNEALRILESTRVTNENLPQNTRSKVLDLVENRELSVEDLIKLLRESTSEVENFMSSSDNVNKSLDELTDRIYDEISNIVNLRHEKTNLYYMLNVEKEDLLTRINDNLSEIEDNEIQIQNYLKLKNDSSTSEVVRFCDLRIAELNADNERLRSKNTRYSKKVSKIDEDRNVLFHGGADIKENIEKEISTTNEEQIKDDNVLVNDENTIENVVVTDQDGKPLLEKTNDGETKVFDDNGNVIATLPSAINNESDALEDNDSLKNVTINEDLGSPIIDIKPPKPTLKERIANTPFIKRVGDFLKRNKNRVIAGALAIATVAGISWASSCSKPVETQKETTAALNNNQASHTEILKTNIDLSHLNDMIKKCEAVNPNEYTKESYDEMKEQLDHAKEIISQDHTQDTIDLEYIALKTKYDSLVKLKLEEGKNNGSSSSTNNQNNNNNENNNQTPDLDNNLGGGAGGGDNNQDQEKPGPGSDNDDKEEDKQLNLGENEVALNESENWEYVLGNQNGSKTIVKPDYTIHIDNNGKMTYTETPENVNVGKENGYNIIDTEESAKIEIPSSQIPEKTGNETEATQEDLESNPALGDAAQAYLDELNKLNELINSDYDLNQDIEFGSGPKL